MTKEQFTSGTPFYIRRKRYAGDPTYSYSINQGCICKQSRSSIDERVIIDDYECTMSKLGRVGFTAFTYVMGKKVLLKYRFSDLLPLESEPFVGE